MQKRVTMLQRLRPSYAMAAMASTQLENVRNTAKPVFIKEIDFFGVKSPPKEQWINHTELYKAISQIAPAENIAGLQRVKGLWRIYMEDEESRASLLTQPFSLRGKQVQVYSSNPGSPYAQDDNSLRVRIKNVPLSADDGQIRRTLVVYKCTIKSFFREKLRVDGRLTNCETGDRIAIIEPIATPLPISMEIGRYRAVVNHRGQVNERLKCTKCLLNGHLARDCENEITCKECFEEGHIKADCPYTFTEGEKDDSDSTVEDDESDDNVDSDRIQSETGEQSANLSQPSTQEASAPPTTDTPTSDTSTLTSAPPMKVSSKSGDKTKKKTKVTLQKSKSAQSKQSVGALDKFLKTPVTGRKSSAIGPEERSPISPVEDIDARNRTNKKTKDG